LHKKLRYYEEQLDHNDQEFIKMKREYDELHRYLTTLGISKKDLKTS